MDEEGPIQYATSLLSACLTKAGVEQGHSVDHAIAVMNHAKAALRHEENLSEQTKTNVKFAALLHDADDDKFFTNNSNLNAITIMDACNLKYPNLQLDIALIIRMISLVSTAKNKNSKVEPGYEWMLIPRWADRLEAIGQIGIERTISYAEHIGNPMTTTNTLPVYNDADIERVAPYSRFEKYYGKSDSVIDHIYDKILHIGLRAEDTTNEYLLRVSAARTQYIKDYLFNFWKQ